MSENQAAEQADEAAFESGYTAEQTETPVKHEPEAKAEPEAAAKTIEQPADPIKEMMARFDKFEQSQNKLAGHIGGLQQNQKEINERLAAAQSATRQVADAPSAAQIAEAAKNPQEWDRLKEDFGEWADATEKFVDHKLAGMKPSFDPQAIENIVSQRVADVKAAIKYETAVDKLTDLHPDFMTIRETPAFIAWRDAMPADEISKFNTSVDARYVGQKLTEFKATLKKAPKPSPQNNRFAAAVNPKSSGGFSQGKTEDDDFTAGYNSA